MIIYQDFIAERNRPQAILEAIQRHMSDGVTRTATLADAYDRQRNTTIYQAAALMDTVNGAPRRYQEKRLASNFFNRLNTQRCAYLLGNGVSFANKTPVLNEAGIEVQIDTTKERLGPKFDADLYSWGYHALIHGVCFGFWNLDRLRVLPVTEFAPLWDAETGALMAGIHYWRLTEKSPAVVELFEPDGYTIYKSPKGATGWQLQEAQAKRAYITTTVSTQARGVVAEQGSNYPGLPVIPMWGSRLRQSTLIGMRDNIDAYDMINSGFANDLEECAQIYWLIQNCGGMTEKDMADFLRDIREKHIANIDTKSFTGDATAAMKPYVQDVPYQGRSAFLQQIRQQIYEDFGALDVHAIAASSTNDHIDAAYQPMDEEADQFEYQVIEAVQGVLRLLGIEDTPVFRRNRVSNLKEQIEAVMLEANYLDTESVLDLLPNVTVDMKAAILKRLDDENAGRAGMGGGDI